MALRKVIRYAPAALVAITSDQAEQDRGTALIPGGYIAEISDDKQFESPPDAPAAIVNDLAENTPISVTQTPDWMSSELRETLHTLPETLKRTRGRPRSKGVRRDVRKSRAAVSGTLNGQPAAQPPPPPLVSIMDAATLVGVARRTIYYWIAKGLLRTQRVASGRIRVETASLFKPAA